MTTDGGSESLLDIIDEADRVFKRTVFEPLNSELWKEEESAILATGERHE
jgi:hypothetical protein